MTRGEEVMPAAAVSRAIGRRVRSRRAELRWTLDQLAERSGVTNRSIATLLRLSDALGVALPALVDTGDDGAAAVVVHRAGELAPAWTELLHVLSGSVVLAVGSTEHRLCFRAQPSASVGGGHRADDDLVALAPTVHLALGFSVLREPSELRHRRLVPEVVDGVRRPRWVRARSRVG